MTDLIEVELEDGTYVEVNWPFCKVPGCSNRCSLRLNSVYCHPHSMGMQPIIEREMETT